ncbi:hypothetical protein [Methylibium rhizosphaerae]|uniref:hypothetical protein n=1 Tax=Methylibium rhizosphaerae TaxID=2570323 RepID=UPI00112C17ED|nr:hypothetical protein [Methylibium rhizosphaerae]
MAGISLRVPAPASFASSARSYEEAERNRLTTRTRRNHGAFLLGNQLLCVFSTRRATDPASVLVSIGTVRNLLDGRLSPAQARSLSSALARAADAAELSQRRGA